MNIFESISAVMKDIGAIGKESRNTQQGFMFRGIDAVMNAINPALVKYKVFIVPEVLDQTREERTNAKGTKIIYSICRVKYTFYAEDGSYIEAVVIGEGMDTGDKATNKALSIAFKYACFQVFCIPTEEMKDPDYDTHVLDNTETIKATKINTTKVAALVAACKERGIEQEKILKLYKVESLADITEAQFANINTHWDNIKNA